jgi:hypothetical protein
MGHHLIDDALKNQEHLELVPYSEELMEITHIKVSYKTILDTPNDAELGNLIREIYWIKNKK